MLYEMPNITTTCVTNLTNPRVGITRGGVSRALARPAQPQVEPLGGSRVSGGAVLAGESLVSRWTRALLHGGRRLHQPVGRPGHGGVHSHVTETVK